MRTQLVLFDVSGVLVELGGMPDFVRWTGRSPNDIASQWLTSECARHFESGQIDFSSFYEKFVEEWQLCVSAEELSDSFERSVSRLLPGALDLINELKARYPLACFTNTNSIQWPIVQRTIRVEDSFDHAFASHLIGQVKPDVAAFQYVLEVLQIPAESIVYLDDSMLNVSAAQAIGLAAHHVVGVAEARKALETLGLLPI
jgi:HAD superfamily hydrolase (TIGR01509 family)